LFDTDIVLAALGKAMATAAVLPGGYGGIDRSSIAGEIAHALAVLKNTL
jgi:2-phosphoglycerate kinase